MLQDRIRSLRKERGYSQQQIALKLHLSQGAISQWENGLTAPSAEQLVALSDVYGITVDELLGRSYQEESEVPKTQEARILAQGIDQMPKEERERALSMVKLIFNQYSDLFERSNADDT